MRIALLLALGPLWPGVARAAGMPAAPPTIVAPLDGATVSRPVVVQFEAGAPDARPLAMSGTGAMPGHRHVHLLIDADPPQPGARGPAGAPHRHFLNGETPGRLH